mmetsp:Transcript_6980/g.42763  ORF Transcript_6980/g.42763 Transcript_6980/m.42763 type:complete len:249 (-) Transcript_6980:434-1180(-)
MLQHLLRDFPIVLSRGVAQMRLHINELIELVKLAIHLQNRYFLTIVSVWAVEELDTRVTACQLAAARNPADGGTLVVEVHRGEVFHALLLDHPHAQHLALIVIRNQLGWQHLDDNIRHLLLRIDVSIKIRLASLNGCFDGLKGMTSLGHVTLDLPGKLNIIRDVEVDLEVQQVTHTLVKEWVEPLNDQDVRCFDGLCRIQDSRHMVVDGFVYWLSLPQGFYLVIHEVKVLGLRCKRSHTSILATVTIQ